MEYISLNNGVQIPATGFGVFRIPEGEDCVKVVLNAIESGYRMFDTAQGYWNETSVGEGIRISGIDRQSLFLTTKIWMSRYGEDETYRSVLESLEKLQTDYLDLVLLHQPIADYFGAYRALEKLYASGRIRAIGVSNFSPAQLTDLSIFNKVIPTVNQIKLTPFIQQTVAVTIHQKFQVCMEAYAPLGAGDPELLTNLVLTTIGKKYGKSSAQVILRWLYQRRIITITKSTHIDRMKSNLNLFDFKLNSEDMAQISSLNREVDDLNMLEQVDYIEKMKCLIDREAYHFNK